MKNRPVLCVVLSTLMLLLAAPRAHATHNRAGEITFSFISGNTIQLTISTWTKTSSVPADRDSLPVDWGDGSPITYVYRTNGAILGIGNNGVNPVGSGVPIVSSAIDGGVKYNTYSGPTGIHTYPGIPPPPNNFYIVSMTDPNRNGGIININQSVNVQFFIEDTIYFPTNIDDIGLEQSPVCLNPPIDFAFVGDTFWHNPAVYDADGDSINFRMIIPLQANGLVVPGYMDPTAVIPNPPPDNEALNIHTGLYMWAVPQTTGIYNVAFLISWYRRGFLMGTIDRDMQIIVLEDTTRPPVVIVPADTCIRAGDPLRAIITGSDPTTSDSVYLFGYGGPLAGFPTFPDSLSPATFTSFSGSTTIGGMPTATGYFEWNTVCRDIQEQPYQFVFKAQNNEPFPQEDEKVWNVLVIPPPPLGLTATIVNRQIQLNWQKPYLCDSISTFRGFSVWRKIGCDSFIPSYCETGLAGRGYTMIANNITGFTYTDLTATHGEDLCYRILANFSDQSPNGIYSYGAVVSVPSNNACAYLPYDVPVITTASVLQTDSVAGQMFVAWVKPRPDSTDFDTTFYLPPYRFDLYRGLGTGFATPVRIHSFSSATFAGLSDTTFIDTGLNTTSKDYSYQVWLYSTNDSIGVSDPASSVFLSTTPNDRVLTLSWAFNVPWIQDSFQIFRGDYTTGGLFNYLATDVTPGSRSYADTGLINDTNYCYYVMAYGHYTSPYIGAPLTDSSEIVCGTPVDTIPPCPPIVTVTNNCGLQLENPCDTPFQFINYLTWVEPDSCASTTLEYYIYYSPDSGGVYTLIDSVKGVGNTSYNHLLNSSGLAGCYIVSAVDKHGYQSHAVNQVCIDDCPEYNLPNTFTPNGDGFNDLFTPVQCPPYRFVTRVDFKIFTRWGERVFETTDPAINWDGTDQKTGKALSDGVYFYAGYYYVQTLHGEVQKPLPPKSGGGFIHLIRDK